MAEIVTKTVHDTITQTVTQTLAPTHTEYSTPTFTTTYGTPWTTANPSTYTLIKEGWDHRPTAVVEIVYPPQAPYTLVWRERPFHHHLDIFFGGIATGLGIFVFLVVVFHLVRIVRKRASWKLCKRRFERGIALDGSDELAGNISSGGGIEGGSPVLSQQIQTGHAGKSPL
jgi:hypothetical protein